MPSPNIIQDVYAVTYAAVGVIEKVADLRQALSRSDEGATLRAAREVRSAAEETLRRAKAVEADITGRTTAAG